MNYALLAYGAFFAMVGVYLAALVIRYRNAQRATEPQNEGRSK